MKSYFVAMMISFFSLMMLSGCETMEGFGRDVEKVGSEIEDEADR